MTDYKLENEIRRTLMAAGLEPNEGNVNIVLALMSQGFFNYPTEGAIDS
jgi:hypothetical protein